MKKRRDAAVRFAVCIKNKGYEASLEKGKLYRLVPDQGAEAHGHLRIIDESGEDCGYAAQSLLLHRPAEVSRERAPGGSKCLDLLPTSVYKMMYAIYVPYVISHALTTEPDTVEATEPAGRPRR
jgi:hypothetical protein